MSFKGSGGGVKEEAENEQKEKGRTGQNNRWRSKRMNEGEENGDVIWKEDGGDEKEN